MNPSETPHKKDDPRLTVPPLNIAKVNRNIQGLDEAIQGQPAPQTQSAVEQAPASQTDGAPTKKQKDDKKEEQQLDEALKHTFPASDPAQQP